MVAVTGRYHGLGNRMRVVLGAQALARFEGRSFRYVWPTGRGFGARLDELWEFHARRWPEALSRALERFPYRDSGLEWIDDAARQERVWQIRTPHALTLPPGAPSWHASLRAMQPVEGIRRRILELYEASADRPYLGVMIRTNAVAHDATLASRRWSGTSTGSRRSARSGPSSASTSRPTRMPRSSGSPAGSPIASGRPTRAPTTAVPALQASVADLYLLASSCHILGPHYSSFPELAWHLAGAAVALETSTSAPSSRFEAQGELSVGTPLRPELRSPGRN